MRSCAATASSGSDATWCSTCCSSCGIRQRCRASWGLAIAYTRDRALASLRVRVGAEPCGLVRAVSRSYLMRVSVPSPTGVQARSEEHTSELQSRLHLVCRLLLEKKKPAERTSAFLPALSNST